MQKFSQKYAIVCLLEDKEEGYEFPSNNWPLHVTIADTFAIEWNVEKLKSEIEHLATQNLRIVKSKAIGEEHFGENKSIHVVLLEKNTDLESLHYSVVNMLKGGGLQFSDPQFSEEGFLPHSTVQKHAQVKMNEQIAITNLVLIDMFPNKDSYQRKIIKVSKFSSS